MRFGWPVRPRNRGFTDTSNGVGHESTRGFRASRSSRNGPGQQLNRVSEASCKRCRRKDVVREQNRLWSAPRHQDMHRREVENIRGTHVERKTCSSTVALVARNPRAGFAGRGSVNPAPLSIPLPHSPRPRSTLRSQEGREWIRAGHRGSDAGRPTRPPDTPTRRNRSTPASCRIAGTTGVQQLTIARGKVTGRRRLIANGANNSFDENGCHGTRAVEWASTGRRVYIHSNYTCDVGLAGTSSGVLAITSTGNWLEVETVHAGQGLIEHVDQWRDAGMPSSLPSEVFNSLESRRMTSTTARASAAAPLTVADVIDALHHVDSSAVRTLIVASGQQFSLNGNEVAALFRANVPRGVLQAMVAWTPQPGAEGPGYDPDAYLRATAGMNYATGAAGDRDSAGAAATWSRRDAGSDARADVADVLHGPRLLSDQPDVRVQRKSVSVYGFLESVLPVSVQLLSVFLGTDPYGEHQQAVLPEFRRGPFGVQRPISQFPNRPVVRGGTRGGHR